MICCNKESFTPFCPMCGKPLAGNAATLLAFLRTRAKSAKVDLDRATEMDVTEYFTQRQKSRRIERRMALHEKWQGWHDIVCELIAKAEATTNEAKACPTSTNS